MSIYGPEIQPRMDEGLTITLVGNQIRQNERLVSKEVGQQKANQLNALFFETSAKDSTNINEIFSKTVEKALLNPNIKSLSKTIGLQLIQQKTEETSKGWCFGFGFC